MVNNGIVIPTTYVPGNSRNAGWSFPCRLISKKTGDKRLVTNFMELNKITVRDTWPLPLMTDLLEQLGGSKLFSSMDLLKGFHQIAVNQQSVNKLTISTPFGNYSYVCMPFGVQNGPSVFCRAIHLALNDLMNSSVVAYIDDIIVHSSSHQQHLVDLESFFQHIKNANMVLNSNKCSLFEQQVNFVGFVANGQGYLPDPARVSAIANFPRPVCVRDVRAFLGVLGFYRRHVHLYTEFTAPLTELLKKNAKFVWNDELESCFVGARDLLKSNCLLYYPDPSKEFFLFCDSSSVGVGSALCQKIDDSFVPVAFRSRKLHAAEILYPTVELELLSVIHAFKSFRKFLLDKKFTLFTDNTAVAYLHSKKDASQRLQRWILCCLEFDFVVKHLPGKQNVVADVLSRYPPVETEMETGLDDIEFLYHGLLTIPSLYEPELESIFLFLLKPWHKSFSLRIKKQARFYEIIGGKLVKKIGDRQVLVPPIEERVTILESLHEGSGHFGQQATWTRLYTHYWWPSAYADVKNHVQTCSQCLVFNLPKSVFSPPNHVIGERLFEQFSIDFIGPFPKTNSGNVYILLAVENFTRWPIAIASPENDAVTTARFLYDHIFTHFGPQLICYRIMVYILSTIWWNNSWNSSKPITR
jgi:hypothetical protein